MAATVQLEAHPLNTRTGLWCTPCALPSVVEVDVAIVSAASLAVIARASGSRCTTCGAEGEVTR